MTDMTMTTTTTSEEPVSESPLTTGITVSWTITSNWYRLFHEVSVLTGSTGGAKNNG